MNKKTYRDVLDSAANDSLSHHANLWPKLSAQLERKSLMQTLRTRPLVMMVVAIVAILLLSGVAYALGRSLGYIPGIGIVDQTVPIRMLAEPVTVQKQGMTITLSKVVADSLHTFISYHVEGLPLDEKGMPVCAILPEVELADGTRLEDQTGSGGMGTQKNGNTISYEDEKIFSPIPDGANNATLAVPCVLADGSASETFELPFHLVPAPAGFATPAAELAVTADGVENKTGLHLEKVLELEDSYILIGKFTDAGDLPGPLYMTTSSDSEYLPQIEDANGNHVPFKVREDARPDPDWDVAYYWAYEIPKPVSAPLKLTVDRVNIRKHSTAQFPFDTGDHLQVNQKWDLKQTVQLGASEFVVDSVTFLGNGYTFKISSENLPAGVVPDIEIVDNSLSPYQFDNINSTIDNSGKRAIDTITLTTNTPPPTGTLTVNWGLDEFIPQPGPWSLVWTPAKTNP